MIVDSIFDSQWISHPALQRFVKQLFRQFVQNFRKKNTCAGVTFEYICRLKDCNFIWKGVQHRCFLVNFAKIFKTATQQLCVAASGISAIVIKTLKIALLYHVYSARMVVELKLGCPKNKWRGKKAWIKRIRSGKSFIRNIFFCFLWYHVYCNAFCCSSNIQTHECISL